MHFYLLKYLLATALGPCFAQTTLPQQSVQPAQQQSQQQPPKEQVKDRADRVSDQGRGQVHDQTRSAASEQDPDILLLKKMSLEQKVGQLFIFGFMGTEANHSLNEIIEKLHPGGILVFGRNIHTAKQVAQLLFDAQTASIQSSRSPLLIAVDQEGGDVIRIRTSPPLPSALALGVTGETDLVHEAGLQTAILLKALGFNMNLAPVLDISDPLKDSFIGTRAFGKDSQIVSQMGIEFADGLRDGGILPTAKHFPGHGGIKTDSHLVTPQKNVGLDYLLNNDLLPYSDLTQHGGASAIMVAHIAFPKIDGSLVPATYSKILIGEVLRNRLGFDGIVMTDDIEMGGAGEGSAIEHAKLAINAGVDLVMMAWNKKMQFLVVKGVINAVKNDEIDEDRIDESVLRILKIKRQFASFAKPQAPDAKKFLNIVRSHGIQSISQKTIQKIFETYKNEVSHRTHPSHLQIESLSATKFFVYSLNEGFYRSFKSYRQKMLSQFENISQTSSNKINKALMANANSYALIYVSGPLSAKLVNSLSDQVSSRTIIVNSETQSIIKKPERFASVLDIYFKHPDVGNLTADYLSSLVSNPREPTSTKTEPQPTSQSTPQTD